jgi:ATP-dependent helicase/nuclease subunit A
MINVIKASAGSGKTYTLAYEYIKLLLGIKKNGNYRLVKGADREYFKHILAVTFTNKATGEMKMRIIKGLYDLANCAPGGIGTYMDRLRSDFNAGLQPTSSDFASEDDVRTAAYNALVKLLFGYTKFNVSTIDSFFQLILRTFAREAVDKYDFDISLDEKSVTIWLCMICSHRFPTAHLIQLIILIGSPNLFSTRFHLPPLAVAGTFSLISNSIGALRSSLSPRN